ncbi:hypothetical protein MJO29_002280 [Puccinia striiformis f. sp. tritici]|uniref:hypothetical protein n=1 Tax=Puccinia striiformis f. sp. tritici TaxID=168172 RepID=UPI0020078A64|nr:hypothetical protein Pst134EA_002576 [Puccinia striiformis f. sp. tritici]KAH9471947.1 hypothetical protein Pst134EA_002576 [Puccinia striiformis f. sp. tritici]KAI7966532.1 hypothetical protein MJO29_002280 [Puccinia striiformis f. sp. tritici]
MGFLTSLILLLSVATALVDVANGRHADKDKDTTFSCNSWAPNGYCVTTRLPDQHGLLRIKRMLKANRVGGNDSLDMNCIDIKSQFAYCCPGNSLHWLDSEHTRTDSDVEGLCEEKEAISPPSTSDEL